MNEKNIKMNFMNVTDSSPLICLLCHSDIDSNAFTNIFYTCFPHSGETCSSFVLKILKLSDSELPSSYLCLNCFNSFWALEQAQNTATSVLSEILNTFKTNNNEKLFDDFLDNTLKDSEIAENSNEATKHDDTNKSKQAEQIVEEYLTEKDIHSLKSIFTSGTVISIQLINKQVNESSIISKDEESQTVVNLPNQLCVNSQGTDVPLISQESNSSDTSQESNVPSSLDAISLEDNSDYEEFETEDLDIPIEKVTKRSCKHCDQTFKTETGLRHHLLDKHPDLRPYICEKCGKAYKHKPALEIHLGMHAGFSPFKCNKCGKCFTQKGALHRHLPLHTNEAPFQCEICGKCFKHHTSYNMHSLSHTGKKDYQCNICDLLLLSTSHLKRHMRVHTGEKPYKCPTCGKSFAERYNLHAHKKIHDPEQAAVKEARRNQHKCVRCTATFGTKAKYMEHLRTHVGELANEKPPSKLSKSDNSDNVSTTPKLQELNGVDLLATCVNEVWQSLSLEEEVAAL
ncbi:zinc finger protein 436-like [Copidosoma floridanum]|uniref:zinc finger protein 436-like n=1 Tax=Copidosoma floridanum TaxID=29053 RepID=UPI0006C9D4A4|nr:zinc finger protein 436-like [Copidosoma floridanum]